MFVADAEGRLVYFNEPAERILGRSFAEAGELPASEWTELFAVEELDGSPLSLSDMPGGVALFERRPAHHTFRMRGLDGKTREVSVTAFPLMAHESDLVGIVNVFWEHRQGEE
jgi:PAS domain-containing protein